MSAFPLYAPIQVAFGLSGNVFEVVNLVLPWWVVFRPIRSVGSSHGFSVLPYTTLLLSSSLWLIYAFHDPGNTFFIVTINGLSLIINKMFVMMHVYYGTTTSKIHTGYTVIFTGVVIGITKIVDIYLFRGFEYNQFVFTGVIAAIADACCSAPQISTIRKVIVEGNSSYLSFWTIVASALGFTSWIIYGGLISDLLILAPKALRLLVTFVQFYLLYRYPQILEQPAVQLELPTYTASPSTFTDSLTSTDTLETLSSDIFSTPDQMLPTTEAPPQANSLWRWWLIMIVAGLVVGGYLLTF